MITKNFFTHAVITGVAFLFFSCGSSKKISYKDAYYFSHHDYSKSANVEPVEEPGIYANADNKVALIPEASPNVAQTDKAKFEIPNSEVREIIRELRSEKKEIIDNVDRIKNKEVKGKERRELKKEVKKEIKEFNHKVKKLEKEKDVKQLTGYLRTGVILGGIGLGTMILGSLFGVSALVTVGALLVLGGIVFILVDLL